MLVQLHRVTKTYRGASRPAVNDVTLTVAHGERLGIIGANGSGKTTLLRLIMQFILPDSGSVRIGDGGAHPLSRVGFVPERQVGLENFTPRELLGYAARMYGLPPEGVSARIEEILALTGLQAAGDDLLEGFSKGMVQRAHIGAALIHRPALLILDEPMSGLDPAGRREVRDLLERLADLTLIMATHDLEQLETFCSAAIIIHEGRLVERVEIGALEVEEIVVDLHPAALTVLDSLLDGRPEILHERPERVRVRFQAPPGFVERLIGELAERQLPPLLRLRSRSILEDLYLRYVQGRADDATPS